MHLNGRRKESIQRLGIPCALSDGMKAQFLLPEIKQQEQEGEENESSVTEAKIKLISKQL